MVLSRGAVVAATTFAFKFPPAAIFLVGGASGSSMYLAGLCASETCNEPTHPLLDFDMEQNRCVCRAHPCWDDNGQVHTCKDNTNFPYLSFRYMEDKTLKCECSSIPHYSSVHIARDLCAGHMCDKPDFPILDFDEDKDECVCRAHPCWNDNGLKHACDQPQFPILRYRVEKAEDGEQNNVCECGISMEKDQVPVNHVYNEGADPNEADFIEDDDEEA
eukprot:gb/GFBE01007624.1/.p1 GENE.gb/GFBE01007624.1/~~gb/GFBE01007624.1/.p1  ORF type:complete len:218 (+),score=45.01 gb/GFBE01007624.1/:1-654(+)